MSMRWLLMQILLRFRNLISSHIGSKVILTCTSSMINIDAFLGRMCFICQENGDWAVGHDKMHCKRCGPTSLKLSMGTALITHMAAHILHDPYLSTVQNPCGFCSQPNICQIYLTKKHSAISSNQQIDYQASKCPKLSKINYGPASEYSQKSPCTNVPIYCPLCHERSPTIWKYNMERHIRDMHPGADPALYHEAWEITAEEEFSLKNKWLQIVNSRQMRRRGRPCKVTLVSEGHSSNLALR